MTSQKGKKKGGLCPCGAYSQVEEYWDHSKIDINKYKAETLDEAFGVMRGLTGNWLGEVGEDDSDMAELRPKSWAGKLEVLSKAGSTGVERVGPESMAGEREHHLPVSWGRREHGEPLKGLGGRREVWIGWESSDDNGSRYVGVGFWILT